MNKKRESFLSVHKALLARDRYSPGGLKRNQQDLSAPVMSRRTLETEWNSNRLTLSTLETPYFLLNQSFHIISGLP